MCYQIQKLHLITYHNSYNLRYQKNASTNKIIVCLSIAMDRKFYGPF